MTLSWFRVGPGRFHLARGWTDIAPVATIHPVGAMYVRNEGGKNTVAPSWSALMEAR